MVAGTVVRQLDTACLPLFKDFSIDHIDVVADATTVVQQAVGPAVQVLLDIFVVTDNELIAASNSTPVGATVAMARITASFAVGVALEPVTADGRTTNHAFLTFTPSPIKLPPLPPVPGLTPADIEGRLHDMLPSPRLELTQALALFGMDSPHRAVVELVDGTIAVRFDPVGSAQRRLPSGQDWGLFANAQAIEGMLLSRLLPPIRKAVPQASVSARFHDEGSVPHVAGEVGLTIVGDFVGHPQIRLAIDVGTVLSLLPGPPRVLRISAEWSFHIFADAVPGFLESLAENLAQDVASDLIDPKLFGGVRTGDRSFFIDQPLTDLAMPGVRLRIDSLVGMVDGMTLGGAALIPRTALPPFKISVRAFAEPFRLQLCSQLARAGSGAPSRAPPTIFNTKSQAQVRIEGGGKLCAVEQRSPTTPAVTALNPPPLGSTDDLLMLSYALPLAVAMNLAQPLTMVVRTARGVRFVDLGRAPPVRADDNGVLLDKVFNAYIPDCLFKVVREKGAYGLGWGLTTEEVKTRPIEEKEWAVYVQEAAGLVVQMVRLQGLDAHDLLRFRSASHAVDVVADAQGYASVPVLLPLAASFGAALLTRADGRSLERHFEVESVAFERHLSLPGQIIAPTAASGSGGLRVVTRSRQQTVVAHISNLGATFHPTAAGEEVELNPQPLPPVESPISLGSLADRAGLFGVDRVALVPGFDDVAVAMMADGSKLLLDVPARGPVRVSGTFAGPLSDIALANLWGLAQTDNTVTVFRVTRSRRDGCC